MNCSENVLLFQTLLGLSWFPSLSGYLGRYGRDPLASLPALSALDSVLFKFLGLPDSKGQIRGRGGQPQQPESIEEIDGGVWWGGSNRGLTQVGS